MGLAYSMQMDWAGGCLTRCPCSSACLSAESTMPLSLMTLGPRMPAEAVTTTCRLATMGAGGGGEGVFDERPSQALAP